jgi:hypothetical protein
LVKVSPEETIARFCGYGCEDISECCSPGSRKTRNTLHAPNDYSKFMQGDSKLASCGREAANRRVCGKGSSYTMMEHAALEMQNQVLLYLAWTQVHSIFEEVALSCV